MLSSKLTYCNVIIIVPFSIRSKINEINTIAYKPIYDKSSNFWESINLSRSSELLTSNSVYCALASETDELAAQFSQVVTKIQSC